MLHHVFHQRLELRHFGGDGVKQQFVVNLQHHLALQAFFLQAGGHLNHGQFDDIGRCPLDGGIDGIALGQGPDGGVAGMDVRQVAPAAEEGFYVAVLPGEGHRVVDERADGGEGGEIVFNQGLGGAAGQLQPLGQAEGRDAVHDAEVGRLGHTALLPRDFGNGYAEDFGGGGGMHVLSVAEGLHQVGVAAQMGHDSQLYLGVIGRYDNSLRRARHEGFSNLLAALRADGDVLQVGVGAGQAPGGREGLVEGGMHAPVLRGNIRGEGLDIGGKELFDGPVFQDFVHDGVPVRNGEKGGLVRAVLAPCAAFGLGVQGQTVKQELSHLLGGGDVQLRVSGHFPDAVLPLRQLFPQTVGKDLELGQVHFHAVPLHLREHLGQGLLHLVIELRQVLAELVSQRQQHGRLLQAGRVLLRGDVVKEGAGSGRGRCF